MLLYYRYITIFKKTNIPRDNVGLIYMVYFFLPKNANLRQDKVSKLNTQYFPQKINSTKNYKYSYLCRPKNRKTCYCDCNFREKR